ncbi:unnamed protein product, partial [Ilex paraguariensis]
STCPRFEEFDDRPSLQKIPELVDSESAGLEGSGATRIFNGFESRLLFDSRRPAQFYGISYKSSLSTIKGKAGSNFSIGRKASTARGRGSSGKRGARNS